MKLKTKYRLLLFSAIISVPVILLLISVLMTIFYDTVFKTANQGIPFHASFAYPTMLVIFFASLFILALLFSKSINSLLDKINLLNKTIRNLAGDEDIPNKLHVNSNDEIGELTKALNLLIERTTYRELELKQQEEIKNEVLNKLRHDINTPLTAIRLQLFNLENQIDDRAPIDSLYRQIQYIADLTNEFNIKTIDTIGHSHIVNDEVNINDLLETIVKKWSYLYHINGIELIYNPQHQNLLWISNELWLQRLFDNIFQNTLTHANAKKMIITIENNLITLSDDGIGFDVHRKTPGLGLTIIEEITRVLKIGYTIHSDENGTSFRFTKSE